MWHLSHGDLAPQCTFLMCSLSLLGYLGLAADVAIELLLLALAACNCPLPHPSPLPGCLRSFCTNPSRAGFFSSSEESSLEGASSSLNSPSRTSCGKGGPPTLLSWIILMMLHCWPEEHDHLAPSWRLGAFWGSMEAPACPLAGYSVAPDQGSGSLRSLSLASAGSAGLGRGERLASTV